LAKALHILDLSNPSAKADGNSKLLFSKSVRSIVKDKKGSHPPRTKAFFTFYFRCSDKLL
jgi:hypothetical protein